MEQHIESIHNASIEILEKAGFNVTSAEIADALERSGVRTDGLTAYFTERQIMDRLACAPKQFTLFARNPAYDMRIGGEESYFAPGYGCTFVVNEDGSRRAAVFNDYVQFAKLVHQSDLFSVNGGILAQPSDLSSEQSAPTMMLATMLLSDKCSLGISSTAEHVRRVIDVASLLFGGKRAFCDKPHVLTLVNTTSPLELGNIAADTILQCVSCNQPLIVSPGPMAGATGPVTIAGNLALGNAEALATIALIQTLQPGIPVLYGLMPTTMNMAAGSVGIGTPVSALQMQLSARLAKRYGLPNRCGGSLTDAKFVGAQSSMESAMVLMATLGEKTSFILHSAGILDSFGAMSYEKFITDLELMRSVKRYLGGVGFSREELAVEEIINEGIGGNHLASEHTLEHFRTAGCFSPLYKKHAQQPGETPEQDFFHAVRGLWSKMLENYQRPAIESGLLSDITKYFKTEFGTDLPSILL